MQPQGQWAQAQNLTARGYRREQIFLGVRRQDQDGSRGRFLQRFEQRVGCRGGSALKIQYQDHPVICLVRRQRQRLLQRTDLVNAQVLVSFLCR